MTIRTDRRYHHLEIVGDKESLDEETVKALLKYIGEEDFLKIKDGHDMRDLKGTCEVVPRPNGLEIDLWVGRIVYAKEEGNLKLWMDGLAEEAEIRRFQKLVPYPSLGA